MSSSTIDNPIEEQTIIAQHVETNHNLFLTFAFFLRRICQRFITYYQQGAFDEDMPPPSFTFVITSLLTLTEIKSQGDPQFPFQTHAQVVMLSVTCVLMYGFSSAAQHLINATHLGPDSVIAITACLGRIASLCILVGSLASLFYI
ncbi:hypothetical protein Hanom_Chr04g00312411 [Helianthus anomalus]